MTKASGGLERGFLPLQGGRQCLRARARAHAEESSNGGGAASDAGPVERGRCGAGGRAVPFAGAGGYGHRGVKVGASERERFLLKLLVLSTHCSFRKRFRHPAQSARRFGCCTARPLPLPFHIYYEWIVFPLGLVITCLLLPTAHADCPADEHRRMRCDELDRGKSSHVSNIVTASLHSFVSYIHIHSSRDARTAHL